MIEILEENGFFIVLWDGRLVRKIEAKIISREYILQLKAAVSLMDVEEILAGWEEKAAKAYVISLLSRQSLFTRQIKEKMLKKGFSLETIAQACSFGKTFGGVDDESLAQKKCEREIQKGKGLLFARQKWERWVEKEHLSLPKEKAQALETQAIYTLLQKKKVDYAILSWEEKKKLFLFLLRKGFAKEHIQEVLSTIVQK